MIDYDRPDKLREECGVFGIYSNSGHNVASLSYYALYALQHRGQESCGIAVNKEGDIDHHKAMGLVPKVFNEKILAELKGKAAIGHVRYSTTGASLLSNAQPLVVKYKDGKMALAHNGNLVNASELREKLEENGAIFQSTIDSEVMAYLISRYRGYNNSIEEAITEMMKEVKGSYALVILTPKKMLGIRDPLGIRPLCIGKIDDSYVLASESCAFDAIGAEFVRDVEPGEIVVISDDGLTSINTGLSNKTCLCIFEHIYFARPDSFIDGASVYRARFEAGRLLAMENPVNADLVIGVPDSGITAALGYSEQSGIPYAQGFIKNRYVGRTFIQPDQGMREMSVRIKLNAMRDAVEGKRVIMVDDSIVRGTTSKRIVQLLRDAGATEVHLKISSPPVKWPCYFGIDTPSRKHLTAACHSVEEIRQLVGADTLSYLSLEGLISTPVGSKVKFCKACFDGNYPIEVSAEGNKFSCG
ncbi:MAG TPA: amidophosphoribosyltransferase [Pseudobacteroides sp.]|nr:amidophosphoribosyltransferase [Pseudobacteroides sp.]